MTSHVESKYDERALSVRARSLSHLEAHPTLPRPGGGRTVERWRHLADIAGRDVCLAKVLEAHYDAEAILAELEGPAPKAGELWAVWAAEPPGLALNFVPMAGEAGVLNGTKAWCSGADIVSHALITVQRDSDRELARVSMESIGISDPPTSWEAVGMARVVSGAVEFDAVASHLVGDTGEYLSRPGFWHGGAGIAACWFGAARSIAETLRTHPKVGKDGHAAAHLGVIDMQLSAGAALLRELACLIDAHPRLPHIHQTIRVRSMIERMATETTDRVGRALGAGPLCMDHEHALRCADLTTFLRQSHAERDWEALGRGAAEDDELWKL
ncbi:MAG: acyl-CoA dehydrogenase [Pseudoxanthomonas sp.]